MRLNAFNDDLRGRSIIVVYHSVEDGFELLDVVGVMRGASIWEELSDAEIEQVYRACEKHRADTGRDL